MNIWNAFGGATPQACQSQGRIWCQRGGHVGKRDFQLPAPDAMLNNHRASLAGANNFKYDEAFKVCLNTAPVIIIGAGRVGRETAKALEEMGIPYRFIESDEKKAGMVSHAIMGDASDKAVLERAGINKSPAVVITSHNDESNVYLTIYCRKLRPDIQIVTRAFVQRSVEPCIVRYFVIPKITWGRLRSSTC